ncbi:unnamed protein product (mitochondrion) [Plasmodiophora brassicae]|uniref:Cytochrome P450 n=2 Tax=Plasmodiophora brassicae TaxID=37360 RepID=A0A3P3YK94_PLABS|nr:unnamed protein product [Plasmodiophora brassicae]
MMLAPVVVLAAAIAAIVIAVVHVLSARQGFLRQCLLRVCCWLRGAHCVFVTDADTARRVLRASDTKGPIIERLLAGPAWAPVLSLESVDGAVWQRMRANFARFHARLPPATSLARMLADKARARLASGALLDSHALAGIVVRSFFEWMFDEPFLDEWEFVVDATWHWRRSIAQKGAADPALKQRVVDWIIGVLRRSRFQSVFGEGWSSPECYSVVLQPFLISPAINYVDVVVAVTSLPGHERRPVGDLVAEALRQQHPFPILERYVEQPVGDIPANSVVFIPFDTALAKCDPRHADQLVFGAGRRACPGMALARSTLQALLEATIGHERLQPCVGYRWSGRRNDGKETLPETVFQITSFARALAGLLIPGLGCTVS